MKTKIKVLFASLVLLLSPLQFVFAAPSITNVMILQKDYKSAVISWTTDTLSNTEIEYGTTSIYDSAWPANELLTTSHTVSLDNLQPSTTYHFIVKSKDEEEERTVSSEYTFTTDAAPATPAPPDQTLGSTEAPLISNVLATSISADSAIITWNTDMPADSLVSYSTDTSYSQTSVPDYTSTMVHTVTLNGLTENTTYNLKVKSVNSSGLPAESQNVTFKTLSASELTGTGTASGLQFVPPTEIVAPAPNAPAPVKVIFPYNVRLMDTVKFRKGPAIYIVKESGLYPFATYADYLAYKKASKKALKTFSGDGSQYTLNTGAARW